MDQFHAKQVSLVKFGVEGGDGLHTLGTHENCTEEELDVTIEIHGFDMGSGLLEPRSLYDLPYCCAEGAYRMDPEDLRSSLKRATLYVGNVAEMVFEFIETGKFALIGAVFFGLDYYTSTRNTFPLFRELPDGRPPRVLCYFDNIVSDLLIALNEDTGD